MNSSQRLARTDLLGATLLALMLTLGGSAAVEAGKAKGVDVEIPFEANILKASALVAPQYVAGNGGNLVVSDAAGGVYSVTMAGEATEIVAKAKMKHPAGVAVAPAGFGSFAGQVFVLSSGDDPASACEVDRVDKGAASAFAKLPDAAGGKATDCRDLEFGAAGTPFAGKLYATIAGDSTIYVIDASGHASAFGSFDKPIAFDLTGISFTEPSDPKAPSAMLVGMRPKMPGASKIGRISIIGPDGKMKDDPYLVGFIRPTAFGYSPVNFGSYGDTFFIADSAKPATAEEGDGDGLVDRVYKGVARPYATRLADPTSLKFVGNKMVIADPAIKGKGQGGIVVISSML